MSFKSLMPFARYAAPSRTAADLDPFTSMRREMDRMFDDVFKGFGNGAPAALTGAAGAPRMDVKETEAGIEITAELPGVDEKDVEVELADDVLTIRGEKKFEKEEGDKEKGYHVMERSYGSFARSVQLPYGAETDKVTADFSKGVLKVVVPRPAEVEAKTKKIQIKAS
ncbi:MAG TPA: Hsp20/alpha crystallin family protein [Dongiaceae bacterium]|jgi:HSP20 family protein|nr:Hsp20/alpha crystallin family protein [Dongiaceae bacterium]